MQLHIVYAPGSEYPFEQGPCDDDRRLCHDVLACIVPPQYVKVCLQAEEFITFSWSCKYYESGYTNLDCQDTSGTKLDEVWAVGQYSGDICSPGVHNCVLIGEDPDDFLADWMEDGHVMLRTHHFFCDCINHTCVDNYS
jgi:hypothetical protein